MTHHIFTNQVPTNLDVNTIEGRPGVTLGTVWQSEHDGVIRGVRFYLGNRNYDNVQVTAGIYDWGTTELLAEQPYTITSANPIGYNSIPLSEQFTVTRNHRYITVIYFPCDTSPDGKAHYVYTNGLHTEKIINSPLHAIKNDTILDHRNGLYYYGTAITFPTNSSGATSYFIDIDFDYVAKMPVYDSGSGTYKQHTLKYREGGAWKY